MKPITYTCAGIAVLIAGLFSFMCTSTMPIKNPTYLRNDSLPVVFNGFPGNAFADGRFIDPPHDGMVPFTRVLKWHLSVNPQKIEKINDPFRLNVRRSPEIFDAKDDMIVWLGHASFFIRLDGKTFLIDPVLDDILFTKRLSPAPVEMKEVKGIDYLLISHTHYDHLDSDTLEGIDFTGTKALLPLAMGELVKKYNDTLAVEEAGWYQKFSTGADSPEVIFLPARHWSKRGMTDTNRVLWGSYIIRGKNFTVYFAGDSAYGEHFAQIGRLFPKIDAALMPIGAYKPDYIMKTNHMTPEEAVRASNDLAARILIPMHYGTFDLSDEPPGEPLRLIEGLSSSGALKSRLVITNPGYILNINALR
jgi:L-ascorbate metabolism protein UlaG (beta-lactamase superfamily)